MNICTIIAKNYVAHARVLAESFTAHHPGSTCFTLIIDDFDVPEIDPANEPFTIVRPSDLDLSEADFDDMRAMYSVLELSTAVKPWLLRLLLDRYDDGSGVAYFDPDICIYARMEELETALGASQIVLTPHLTKPLPRDGRTPGETDIMIAGIYNLGFIGLSAGSDADALLAWWQERLRSDCWVAVDKGLFVDQKWIDWAPGLFPSHTILRDPTYNIAYWNLVTRSLEGGDGDGYTVDGAPLRFFHFSGYAPSRPRSLSKHQDRIELLDGTVLAEVCDGYGAALRRHGIDVVSPLPYSHDRLPSGERIDRIGRALYREGHDAGLIRHSVFTAEGERELVEYMNEPAQEAPGLTRYLYHHWAERLDLQLAYPDVGGVDLEGYIGWCRAYNPDIPERMLENGLITPAPPTGPASPPGPAAASRPDAPAPDDARTPPVPRPFGVNVVGYLRAELGVGEVARQMIGALDAASVPVLPRVLDAPLSRQGHPFATTATPSSLYPVNLVFANADALPGVAAELGSQLGDGRYNVGFWWWELQDFPERFAAAAEHLDEIWVGSEFVAQAVRQAVDTPVYAMPVPLEMAVPPRFAAGELDWPTDAFTFHFSWDYNSVFQRKNPLAVAQAYAAAFDPHDGAALVLKCINGDKDPAHHAEVLAFVATRPDITLIDEYVSARDKNRLVASCDCYVSLHRSEGLGLTIAEAMLAGKPVIATNYSGNTDFMTAANAYPVGYALTQVGPGAAPYDEHAHWAEPDVAEATRLMRHVFEHQDEAREKGRLAAETIRSTYSAPAVGRALAARLERIRTRTGGTIPTGAPLTAPITDGLAPLVARRTQPRAPSRFGKPGAAVRKAVLRVMRPYTAYQGDVNEGVVDRLLNVQLAIEQVDHSTRSRATELESLHRQDLARVLGELRDQRRTVESLVEAISHETLSRTAETGDLRRSSAGLSRLLTETYAIPYMASDALSTFELEETGTVFGYQDAPAGPPTGDDYREFEEIFRGSEDLIRGRMARYLPLLQGPVVDLGCGRGELLDLLRDAGVEAVGVDSDAGMVARCQAKGHAATVLGDALEYLAAVEDGSLGTVFSAQVVEHLPPGVLVELIGLARRKLRPGGTFIAETVNPHSVAALKTFWVDITHHHPLFPESMVGFARIAGYRTAYVFHPNGTGDVEADRATTGEYALVAVA